MKLNNPKIDETKAMILPNVKTPLLPAVSLVIGLQSYLSYNHKASGHKYWCISQRETNPSVYPSVLSDASTLDAITSCEVNNNEIKAIEPENARIRKIKTLKEASIPEYA